MRMYHPRCIECGNADPERFATLVALLSDGRLSLTGWRCKACGAISADGVTAPLPSPPVRPRAEA